MKYIVVIHEINGKSHTEEAESVEFHPRNGGIDLFRETESGFAALLPCQESAIYRVEVYLNPHWGK